MTVIKNENKNLIKKYQYIKGWYILKNTFININKWAKFLSLLDNWRIEIRDFSKSPKKQNGQKIKGTYTYVSTRTNINR